MVGAPLPPSPSGDVIDVVAGHHGVVIVGICVDDVDVVRRGENVRDHALDHVYVVGRIHATPAPPS